jgi:hypothetical protein
MYSMDVRWRVRFVRFFLGIIGIGILLVLAIAYFRRDLPMLYRLEDASCACVVPAIVAVPNPFRDRSPEQPATDLLQLLEQDKCEAAVAALANAVHPSDFCRRGVSEANARPHVTNWSLCDRVNDGPDIRLTYTVHIAGQSKSSLLWFRVNREGQRWVALYMGDEVGFE